MDFYSLIEYCQLKAMNSCIDPSLESIWNLKCREYSLLFHTPLHVVHTLDPTFILTNLYEHQYHPSIVESELEDLLDKLYVIQDPSYTKMSKEEMEALVDTVMNKEIARMAKKKKLTPQKIASEIKEETFRPKSGSMNFSELESLDSRSGLNKGSFEE